eukprot:320339-Pyramimonas_sp.AAC.2
MPSGRSQVEWRGDSAPSPSRGERLRLRREQSEVAGSACISERAASRVAADPTCCSSQVECMCCAVRSCVLVGTCVARNART